MKKNILLASVAVIVISICAGTIYVVTQKETTKTPVNVQKERSENFNNMKSHRHSKDFMEAKKAEFEKRLKLTEEQKQEIEKNRLKEREMIKPFIEMKISKNDEINNIYNDSSLTEEQKAEKIEKLREEISEIRLQERKIHEEDIKKIEEILNEKQKKEFAKIREEQRKAMEKRRKAFQQ